MAIVVTVNLENEYDRRKGEPISMETTPVAQVVFKNSIPISWH
jgi:hypothetical protein